MFGSISLDVGWILFAAALGAVLVMYGLSALWWLFEVVVLSRGWRSDGEFEWGLEDVQVRILTVDAERVVQGTVETVPDAIDDVHVIAEKPMRIAGATVHVVPDSFECAATNKGRALEWASRTLSCEREYVCYLDEDTLVTDFTGMPDADIVQFTEQPIYTGSWLAWCCEVFRVGYQFEQFGFHRLRYPLYAWGGGVAIRSSLEDQLGWDVETITEDTNFVWRAAREHDVTFRVVDTRFRNQAPPSLKAMFRQRRRWISGSLRDDGLLPLSYRPLYFTRVFAWACSPAIPLALLVSLFMPGTVALPSVLGSLSTLLGVVLVAYMCCGLWAYRMRPLLWPAFALATPVAVVLHAIGAAWGVLSPVREFEVTEKVAPKTIESVHPSLENGDVAAHNGTGRLLGDMKNRSEEADTEQPLVQE